MRAMLLVVARALAVRVRPLGISLAVLALAAGCGDDPAPSSLFPPGTVQAVATCEGWSEGSQDERDVLTQGAWLSIREERPDAALPEDVSRQDRAALTRFFDAYCTPATPPDEGLLPPMFAALQDGSLSLSGLG